MNTILNRIKQLELESIVESLNLNSDSNSYLNEQVSMNVLRDMKAFGLSKYDIDKDGYVKLYHGGKELPERLKENDIFFMTPSYDEALDYANMRSGEVFEIKVKPEDVNWNQGSYEVEFDKGGIIRGGRIIPKVVDKKYLVNPFTAIKQSFYKYNDVDDELFKWIERTLNYYITSKKMNPIDSYNKLVEDIEYYFYLDTDDKDFTEFGTILKYNDFNKLNKDLNKLTTISFDECFYEI